MPKLQGPRSQQIALTGTAVGSCLAIHLSQDPRSVFAWTLRVSVRTEGKGSYTLGRAVAMPAFDPMAAAPPQGFPKLNDAGRVVAMAYCPGAVEWTVDAAPFNPFPEMLSPPSVATATCELQLSSDRIASALDEPGVVVVNSDGRGATWAPKQFALPAALAQQGQLCEFPAYLWKLAGIGTDAPADGLFLQAFDTVLALANGAQPIWSTVGKPIPGSTGIVSFSESWPRGLYTRKGLRLATSSTYPLLTLAGSYSVSSEIEIVPRFEALP